MIFNFLKIRFTISLPFVMIIVFLLITDKTGLMTASLAAVIFHEIGHIIAMRIIGCIPSEVRFSTAGVLIIGQKYCSFSENIIIALSGPFSNFIFVAVFYLLSIIFDNSMLIYYCAVQLLIGLINLLPVKGLDGGVVLFLMSDRLFKRNSMLKANFISIVFAFAVLVLGVAVAIQNASNPSLLLLGIYLIILNIIKS